MMTLTQTERLARKIAEVAAQPANDTQTAKLAHDYAEICRAANRRLEQCALMIEAGQFLQALQLAETAPPLMELITLLGFRQASEWRANCQAHQLPWAEPFYDKYIRLLNNAYAKGIDSDHPFYRDYRAAILENDDAGAFSILRVIARLNPSDSNTREEMRRLEEKLLRVRMENLRQVVAGGDPVNIEAALQQLEASGLPVPDSHPVWQQAQIVRCQSMLRRAAELRSQDLWQEAEAVVEEIHALSTRHNLRLPDADADAWSALEEWTAEKRAAFAAEQDSRRAVSALEYELDSLGARRAAEARLKSADARAGLSALTQKWLEAEHFKKPLDGNLAARYQQCGDWLRQQIHAAVRRNRVLAVVVVFVILAAIGAAIPASLKKSRQAAFARQIEALEPARKVSEVERLAAQAPESWKHDPGMAGLFGKAKEFVAQEKELKQAFDQRLDVLRHIASAGFGGALDQVGSERASCELSLNRLAPEFLPDATRALAAWDAQWQTFRNKALGEQLHRAEETAAALNATHGVEPVRAAIAQIQAVSSGLPLLQSQPPPLDEALAERAEHLSNEVANWTETAGKWEQAQAALRDASSLDEYLKALEQLALSPFATTAQKNEVARIAGMQITRETLLGQLLRPDDHSAWDSLTNVADWSASLMPEQPTSQEKDLYFKLRDDKNVRDVYAYELITNAQNPRNPFRSHPIFVQGKMAVDNTGLEAGMVYDAALFPDRLRFEHKSYSDWDYSDVQFLRRLVECDSYERLGLGELIDANTGNYQKPILQLFDQLNQDTNASAIYRAFVTLKLLAVAQLRPSEWGLTWCPSAAAHVQALTELGAKDIQSGDWMVPARSEKLERPLQTYFEKARLIPLESQARFLQQLARDTCAKGFAFAGFIDASGHPVLRPFAGPSNELCGWNGAGAAVLLLTKVQGGDSYRPLAEPLPFSPLFAFAGDRRKLLLQTLSATAYPAALAGPILPPFFGGAL